MKKAFTVIVAEILLLVVVGILTSLVASTISLDITTLWITLLLAMFVLVPTSWLKFMYERGEKDVSLNMKIPDQISLSISLESIKKNSGLLFTLILNAVIYGWLSGYVSVLISREGFAYYFILDNISDAIRIFGISVIEHEILGCIFITFASLIVMMRLSIFFGIIFCACSSLVFSLTHLTLVPYQAEGITIVGNLVSFLVIAICLRIIYPLIAKFIIEFWKTLFN